MGKSIESVMISMKTRKAINILEEMSDEKFKTVMGILEKLPTIKNQGELSRALTGKFEEKHNIEMIVELLIDLDSASREFDSSFDSYADNVLLSVCSNDELKNLILKKIMEFRKVTKCVTLISKAKDLWNELPRKLTHSRILSDIRPIFGDALEGIPANGVIVHTLVLTFEECSKKNEFHVNFDQQSLKDLKSNIDRALEKELLIGEVMGKINMDLVNPKVTQ